MPVGAIALLNGWAMRERVKRAMLRAVGIALKLAVFALAFLTAVAVFALAADLLFGR